MLKGDKAFLVDKHTEQKDDYFTNSHTLRKPFRDNKSLHRKKSEKKPSRIKNEYKQVEEALGKLERILKEIDGGTKIFAKTEQYILKKLKYYFIFILNRKRRREHKSVGKLSKKSYFTQRSKNPYINNKYYSI